MVFMFSIQGIIQYLVQDYVIDYLGMPDSIEAGVLVSRKISHSLLKIPSSIFILEVPNMTVVDFAKDVDLYKAVNYQPCSTLFALLSLNSLDEHFLKLCIRKFCRLLLGALGSLVLPELKN